MNYRIPTEQSEILLAECPFVNELKKSSSHQNINRRGQNQSRNPSQCLSKTSFSSIAKQEAVHSHRLGRNCSMKEFLKSKDKFTETLKYKLKDITDPFEVNLNNQRKRPISKRKQKLSVERLSRPKGTLNLSTSNSRLTSKLSNPTPNLASQMSMTLRAGLQGISLLNHTPTNKKKFKARPFVNR